MKKVIRKAVLLAAVVGSVSSPAVQPASATTPAAAPVSTQANNKRCAGTAVAPAGSNWREGVANNAVLGSPRYQLVYDLTLQSSGAAQVQVMGFNARGKFWAGVPLMSPDSPHRVVRVAWGNNAANPRIRVKPAFAQVGATVTFRC
ncbi:MULTISPECIES: hypothetical protein [Actinomadura]|uniref:Secreted protein n=1 Tax=Actinomadura yumaensis TaxID=111807 RepID=A0ABW2CCY1_9ACTN|nr:hypothetical protein [Actinomadura sp. J1-007]MWK38397.1 hypothetical protein [Actinomadura sp. J1-007]